MNRPPGIVLAFIIGLLIGGLTAFSFPFALIAWILTPALMLGMRVADALPSDASFARLVLQILSAGANGLCFAGLWALAGEALEGRGFLSRFRVLFMGLMLSGLSLTFYFVAQWVPRYEPPPPPLAALATESPLTGRWEGFAQSAHARPTVVLICRPRVDGSLDAFVYMNDQPLASIEEGRVVGDSVYFHLASSSYAGERSGDSLRVEDIDHSLNWTMALRLASRDTTNRL